MYGLSVGTYVIVRSECPIRFCVLGSGQVEVTLGGPRDGCQLLLDAESLRHLLELGQSALREMDDRFARECGERETMAS